LLSKKGKRFQSLLEKIPNNLVEVKKWILRSRVLSFGEKNAWWEEFLKHKKTRMLDI
jgi:hypothetical protein